MKTPAERMVDSFYAHMGANSGSKPMAAAMQAALDDVFGTETMLDAGVRGTWARAGIVGRGLAVPTRPEERDMMRAAQVAMGILSDG